MNLRTVRAAANQLKGKKARGTSLGHGSFLTLEFGPKTRTAGGHVHGKWHLWVYCCAWSIQRGPRVIAASEDDRAELRKKVAILNGRRLSSIEIEQPISNTVFSFQGAVTLRTFGIYSKGYEHWMLFTSPGRVLTIGPGDSVSLVKATLVKATG